MCGGMSVPRCDGIQIFRIAVGEPYTVVVSWLGRPFCPHKPYVCMCEAHALLVHIVFQQITLINYAEMEAVLGFYDAIIAK